jgi:hypothetical protein
VKYRQTLAALGGQLDEAGHAAASDVAVLGTPAGASALEAAFTPRSASSPRRPAHGTALLDRLRGAGAHDQAAALADRLPAVGMFGLFLAQ